MLDVSISVRTDLEGHRRLTACVRISRCRRRATERDGRRPESNGLGEGPLLPDDYGAGRGSCASWHGGGSEDRRRVFGG